MKVEWKSCFRVGVSALILYLCITYWSSAAGFAAAVLHAAMPLIIGCVIAYVINILMSFYETHYRSAAKNPKALRISRPVCMVGAFVTLLAVIYLVISLVLPELLSCVELLVSKVPAGIVAALVWMEEIGLLSEELFSSLNGINWNDKMEQIMGVLTSGVGNMMGTAINVLAGMFSGVVTGLLALIFSLYLLSGKEQLAAQFDRLLLRCLKGKWYGQVRYVLSVLDDCFHRYIVGQCTEAVILGSLCAAGMMLLGLPYATMIGALVAFTALIPVAGAYIGAGVGAFMILTVSPVKALVFLGFIVVLQQLEGNLVYPRVVGSSMGLPAIWVLAAVTVGGGVMGIVGMLLGVPLAAAAYRLVREDVLRFEKENRRTQEIETE